MQEINYTITRKKRKTAMIKIDNNCNVLVSVPLYWNDTAINSLIAKKKTWIERAITQIQVKISNQPTIPDNHIYYRGAIYKFVRKSGLAKHYIIDDTILTITASVDLLNNNELKKFYKSQAKFLIPAMVYKIAKQYNIIVGDVYIGHAKRLYGSCKLNNIMITERLILAPQEVINSVIYHELAHIEHPNHSKNFYNALYKLCPDYDKYNQWLKDFGAFLTNTFYKDI